MKKILMGIVAVLVVSFSLMAASCDIRSTPVSNSGVSKVDAVVKTQANGKTTEQNNVNDRLSMENAPGKVMYLYILSAYSGQVIMYSTVKGKVTSSGKRLTPYTAQAEYGEAFKIYNPDGSYYWTNEVLGDDGTYGNSVDYLYWWDVEGAYHQQYIQGGMILHISDRPLSGVHSVGINLDSK
jgi:hypothetical protein